MTDAYEAVVSIVVSPGHEPEPGEMEATTEVVVEAVQRQLPFVAMGAVGSVDFTTREIEILCTIQAGTVENLHATVARVSAVMLEAANSFEYNASSTHRLEPALA